MIDVTLQKVIDAATVFLEEDMTAEEKVECRKIGEWLSDYKHLIEDEDAALELACTALRRMVDREELGEAPNTPGSTHLTNRLNKLIGNLEELVKLERKDDAPATKGKKA
jgi:hypothetical protein